MKLLPSASRDRPEGNIPANARKKIAGLAYAIYEQEGKPEGKAWEHWFNAEGMVENNFGYGANHTEHDFAKDNELVEK